MRRLALVAAFALLGCASRATPLWRTHAGDDRAPANGETNGWHLLTVSAHLRVLHASFDDVALDARDATFAEGKIGLYTKADAVSDFDDLEIVAE